MERPMQFPERERIEIAGGITLSPLTVVLIASMAAVTGIVSLLLLVTP